MLDEGQFLAFAYAEKEQQREEAEDEEQLKELAEILAGKRDD